MERFDSDTKMVSSEQVVNVFSRLLHPVRVPTGTATSTAGVERKRIMLDSQGEVARQVSAGRL